MENRIIEKNKYLIYNSDNKILVFMNNLSKGINISYPRVIPKDAILDSDSIFYRSIINLLVDDSKLVLLDKIIYNKPIFKSENNKLKKQTLQVIKMYYSYYRDFSSEDYKSIMDLCYKEGFLPYFLTIEELKEITESAIDTDIDKDVLKSLDELEKRLSYKKY